MVSFRSTWPDLVAGSGISTPIVTPTLLVNDRVRSTYRTGDTITVALGTFSDATSVPPVVLNQSDNAVTLTDGAYVVQAGVSALSIQGVPGSQIQLFVAPVAPTPVGLSHAVSGAPAADGVSVVAVADQPGRLQLRYGTDPALAGAVLTAAAEVSAPDLAARFNLTGLPAATRIYYQLVSEGVNLGAIRSAKTAPTNTGGFSFAFGSCGEAGNAPVWDQIAGRDPDFMFALGDTPYIDRSTNDPAAFRGDFASFYGSSHMAALLGEMPWIYTWSDHDYSTDNQGSSAASKPAVQQVYREYQPHYALPDANAIYFAFDYGPARFIVPDLRSEKSGSTFISTAQMTWLKAELTAAEAAGTKLIVIASEIPWIVSSGDADTWFGAAAQRQEISDHIISLGLHQRTVMICGDQHSLSADDGSNNTFNTDGIPTWPVYQSAPLNKNHFSNKSDAVTTPARKNSDYQYSIMTVTPNGDEIDVSVTAYANDVAEFTVSHTTADAPVQPPSGAFGDIVGTGVSRSVQSGATPTDLSSTVSLSAPATAGNLIVIAGGPDKGFGSITWPSGFTEAVSIDGSSGDSLNLAFKIATGGEEDFPVSWATAAKYALTVAEYQGPFDPSPLDVTTLGRSASNTLSVSSPAPDAPAQDDNLVVTIGTKESGSFDEQEIETLSLTAGIGAKVIGSNRATGPAAGTDPGIPISAQFAGVVADGAVAGATVTANSTTADGMAIWQGYFKRAST